MTADLFVLDPPVISHPTSASVFELVYGLRDDKEEKERCYTKNFRTFVSSFPLNSLLLLPSFNVTFPN